MTDTEQPASDGFWKWHQSVATAICRYVALQPEDRQKLPAIQFINNRSDEIAFAAISALRQQERQEGEGGASTPTSDRLAAAEPVAVIRFDHNRPGNENEMPKITSCDWLPDGEYALYTSDAIQAAVDAERERNLADISVMMNEFVDNWPPHKKVGTSVKLIAKTLRAALDRSAIEGIEAPARVREGGE